MNIWAGTLVIHGALSKEDLLKTADVLSAVASDIRKGENKSGHKIELYIIDEDRDV